MSHLVRQLPTALFGVRCATHKMLLSQRSFPNRLLVMQQFEQVILTLAFFGAKSQNDRELPALSLAHTR